jgi:hypothetical protein
MTRARFPMAAAVHVYAYLRNNLRTSSAVVPRASRHNAWRERKLFCVRMQSGKRNRSTRLRLECQVVCYKGESLSVNGETGRLFKPRNIARAGWLPLLRVGE